MSAEPCSAPDRVLLLGVLGHPGHHHGHPSFAGAPARQEGAGPALAALVQPLFSAILYSTLLYSALL